MRKRMLMIVCLSLAACDSSREAETTPPAAGVRDTTQAQMPGTNAIERARDEQAKSKDRANMLDSIR